MLKSLTITKIWLWLVGSWFVCGVVGTIAGFTGLFYPILAVCLVAPMAILLAGSTHISLHFQSFQTNEKIVFALICLWWFLHSLQVFVPETGFDALWYHLPLAQQTVSTHRFIGTTDFYQSFNPQFSDSIFYLGFAGAGETGAKIVAFLLGMTLAVSTYILSRTLLNRSYALVTVLLVSSFQVISWQSSSFYIDIAKAVWEISALIFILQKQPLESGLALGASLASKVFSVLLLPVYALISWIRSGKKQAVILVISSLLVALPYYVFAMNMSGNPLYSAFHHVGEIESIGEANSSISYLGKRTLLIPYAFIQLAISRDYTTPLLLLFFPLAIWFRKEILKNNSLFALAIFSIYQLLLWWYLPPTSTRYALSGFIAASLVSVFMLQKVFKSKQGLFYGLVLTGILAMPIRIGVAHRSWEYISGQQSKSEYLEQFLDGNINSVLKKWHQLD